MKRGLAVIGVIIGSLLLGASAWFLLETNIIPTYSDGFASKASPEPSPVPSPTPNPVSSPASTTKPPTPPASTEEEGATTSPDSAPTATPQMTPSPTPTPAPTLTAPRIFALLDEGKISTQEALRLLGTKSPVNGTWVTRLENLVGDRVNHERRIAHLDVLELDPRLSDVARGDSQRLADQQETATLGAGTQWNTLDFTESEYRCFGDPNPSYTESVIRNTFQSRLYLSTTYNYGIPVKKHYIPVEELAQQIVDTWMDISASRKYLLDPDYKSQGIGVVVGPNENVYVTQNFC